MTTPLGPAFGLLELCSVARGMRMADAMVKRAPVFVRRAGTVHPGKYLVFIQGGVDEVAEALDAGQQVAAETLIDRLFLPYPHDDLVACLDGPRAPAIESLGILEAFAVAATLRAADAALKRAAVESGSIRLADDLGGKGVFVFTGALHDVEEALEIGRHTIGAGLLAGAELIANPHADFLAAFRR
ncbi:MAG: BMC domain-containing protein [bacterium]